MEEQKEKKLPISGQNEDKKKFFLMKASVFFIALVVFCFWVFNLPKVFKSQPIVKKTPLSDEESGRADLDKVKKDFNLAMEKIGQRFDRASQKEATTSEQVTAALSLLIKNSVATSSASSTNLLPVASTSDLSVISATSSSTSTIPSKRLGS